VAAGARPSPNIWQHPATYELENLAVDPDGLLEQAMRDVRGWAGARVLDIGCGSGFHLPRFAATAASVVGVEPHRDLVRLARRRCRGLRNVAVHPGTAQALPVRDSRVDVAHARWAYFFGPGCEPGLAELDRVLAPGGAAFVIDNDTRASTFGSWFLRGLPDYDADAVERFWSRHGWQRRTVSTRWRFARHADLEAVVRIEFAPELAEQLLAEHRLAGAGLEVDYAVNLWWRRKDVGRVVGGRP